MTTPPFSGNDFRDQIDSVARNLTGGAFRLKQNDPDAPLKFMDFVAQSENEFMQVQPQAAQPTTVPQQISELEMLNAQAERRIADPQEQVAPFQFGALQETPPSASGFTPGLTGIGADFLPFLGIAEPFGLIGEQVGRSVARDVFDAGPGVTNVAGFTGAALSDPASLAGIARGGVSGLRAAGRGTQRVAGAATDVAADVGAAAERSGIPSPVSVARALEPEDTLRSTISSQPENLIDTFVINTDETRRIFETPVQKLSDDDLRLAAIHAQSNQFSDSPGVARIGNILNTNVEREVSRRGLELQGSGANTTLRPLARAADDVPPRLPEQAVQPQVADDAALRTIEEATPLSVADEANEAFEAAQKQTTFNTESVELPEDARSIFGLRGEIDFGLSRKERAVNQVRNVLGENISDTRAIKRALGPESDPIIEPIFNKRTEVIRNAENLSRSITTRIAPRVKRVFDIGDNGAIESLRGVDPDIVGAPSIQDVAARLPRYLDALTPDQQAMMRELQEVAEPFGRALRDSGDDFGQRVDIMEGGFYLPRGNAATGEAASHFRGGRIKPGGRISQEQTATFPSMAEGINAGYTYPSFDEALSSLITRSGQRVADNFFASTLRGVRDEAGQKFGLTAKEVLVRDNPQIAAQFEAITKSALKLKTLLKNKDSQVIRSLDRLLADPEFDDIAAVRKMFLNSRTVLRGEFKGKNIAELRVALNDLQKNLAGFRPVYERAKKSVVRSAGLRQIGGAETFPQLNGLTFPERMAARANDLLAQEQARTPTPIQIADAIQRMWKAGNATLDNSGIGIQGLLGAADNPIRGAKAARESLKAWRSPEVYADWATDFNTKSSQAGRLTTDQWAGETGLAQLGQAPDVSSGILEAIPGIGRVFEGADRAFAVVGDVSRAEWADDLLREEIALGRTVDEIRSSGDLQRIADTVNAATGYVNGNFSLSNLIMFSARFFTSRILSILRAARGMDIDAPLDLIPIVGGRAQAKLPKVNKFSRVQDKYARRAIMRMLGYGTLLTVAINEMQGRDTDFRPVVNGRYNSNFNRFRAFNRDWSVFGPWDSIARMFVNLGSGKVKDTVRTLGNAPFVAMGMDLFENKDFIGSPIFDKDGTQAEQAAQILQYLGEGALPFAATEASDIAGDALENLQEGDLQGLGINGIAAASEGFGIKSSPLSKSELEDLLKNPDITPEQIAEIRQELQDRQSRFDRFKDQPSNRARDRQFPGLSR